MDVIIPHCLGKEEWEEKLGSGKGLGTFVEAFQKRVIIIDLESDSPSKNESDDVEVVVPSPTPSPISTQAHTSPVVANADDNPLSSETDSETSSCNN
jgi:hypothetical protein